jgi:hypothetical protein
MNVSPPCPCYGDRFNALPELADLTTRNTSRVPVVSKLYFLLHGTRFAAKNACPQGDESHSEVARFLK